MLWVVLCVTAHLLWLVSQAKSLIPALDYPAGADHALERLAAREGGVELAAVLQPAAVVGGDQRALDRLLAVAGVQVFDDQFAAHVGFPL